MDAAVHLYLTNIWLGFLGLFLTFYVVLDGFDLGIGMLSLIVGEEDRREIMIASLSSVWDANETWLIVFGGALFGAFPEAYGVTLHALYLPIITMIIAFACRGVAFEFREHAHGRRLWDRSFAYGSLVAAICQGFALGGLISGIPVHAGVFTGGPFDWATAFRWSSSSAWFRVTCFWAQPISFLRPKASCRPTPWLWRQSPAR